MPLPKRKYPGIIDRLHSDLEERGARVDEAIASSTSYTPAVAADWNDDPPSTLAEALDRIASALGPVT